MLRFGVYDEDAFQSEWGHCLLRTGEVDQKNKEEEGVQQWGCNPVVLYQFAWYCPRLTNRPSDHRLHLVRQSSYLLTYLNCLLPVVMIFSFIFWSKGHPAFVPGDQKRNGTRRKEKQSVCACVGRRDDDNSNVTLCLFLLTSQNLYKQISIVNSSELRRTTQRLPVIDQSWKR